MMRAPIDRWTAGYALVAMAAVLWRRPPGSALLLLAHGLVVALACAAPSARASSALGGFVGECYPLLICPLLYTAVGLLNQAAAGGHDGLILRYEEAAFSTQPSLSWIRSQPWPWLSALMHTAYLAKYPMLVVAPLALWLSGRRFEARSVLLLVMVSFYSCYAFFLVFPVAGPRFLFPLPVNAATLTPTAVLAHRILDAGSAWGTAFPSSHVAVALVASVSTCSFWPKLGAPLVAVAAVLAPATVYCQFHYGLDALAGLLVGIAVLVARHRICRGVSRC